MLSQEEQARYARHFSLQQVGVAGQEKLKKSSILCIGAGGLGSPSCLYLAAAGVGRIGIVDPDTVELSNLQRQIVHSQSSLGLSKLESATARLREINPHVKVEQHACRFNAENAMAIASQYDVIIDGTDNFPTRYISNDVSFFLKKPNVYASIFQFEGQLSVFAPHLGGPCYRCMLPEPPDAGSVPSCAEAGVLGVLPGIMGSLQAMEAIKIILGCGTPPLGRPFCRVLWEVFKPWRQSRSSLAAAPRRWDVSFTMMRSTPASANSSYAGTPSAPFAGKTRGSLT